MSSRGMGEPSAYMAASRPQEAAMPPSQAFRLSSDARPRCFSMSRPEESIAARSAQPAGAPPSQAFW